MRLPLPRARGIIRLKVGPSPTTASLTTKPSAFKFALFSAFAIALLSVLLIRNAAFLGVKARTSSAAETGRPWISRVTSRTLNGEIRAYLYIDLTSIILKSCWVAHPPGGGHPLLFFPSPNPFLESLHRKFSDAHLPPALSRFSG